MFIIFVSYIFPLGGIYICIYVSVHIWPPDTQSHNSIRRRFDWLDLDNARPLKGLKRPKTNPPTHRVKSVIRFFFSPIVLPSSFRYFSLSLLFFLSSFLSNPPRARFTSPLNTSWALAGERFKPLDVLGTCFYRCQIRIDLLLHFGGSLIPTALKVKPRNNQNGFQNQFQLEAKTSMFLCRRGAHLSQSTGFEKTP